MSGETITVKVQTSQLVRAEIAEELCSSFAEWLEKEGLVINENPANRDETDDRSYEDLARDFVAALVKAED